MEAYSLDIRKRVLGRCDAGYQTKQVADLFNVSTAWVRRLKQRRRELGIVDRLPQNPGRKAKLTADDLERLADLVAQCPDATLAELRERLGKPMGLTTLCRALAKLELTFKKSRSTPPSKTALTSRPAGESGTTNSTP
jgi:transposase